MKHPSLLFSDQKGKIHKHPYLKMAGSSLNVFKIPKENELIKLPRGSTVFFLPYRTPVGFNTQTGEFEPFSKLEGKEVFAVGAFIVPAYLRLFNPASIRTKKEKLPLWAYAACGMYGKDIYVAAIRIDRRIRQSPHFYDAAIIRKKVKECINKYPKNRLYKHLANCAVNYNCLAAKNLFMQRWEAPLPTSRFCNARCIGCLSYQESDCIASHHRIAFKPEIFEIYEVMYNHLSKAKEPTLSFGQGCEGEPLLMADSIAKAIGRLRQTTDRGTINMNTNASIPEKIKLLCEAGIDSFRVSLNSPQEKFYNRYFNQLNYKFKDVLKSIAIAKKSKKFVSINLFVFPGFSDSEEQIRILISFIKDNGIDMIQLRNLNIDPDYYFESLNCKNLESMGVLFLLNTIRKELPYLKIGYFNLPKEQFKTFKNVVR